MSGAAAVAPAGAQNLANYPQSGFRTDRLGLLKQNKERTEANRAFTEGFQPILVALVIPWKQPEPEGPVRCCPSPTHPIRRQRLPKRADTVANVSMCH